MKGEEKGGREGRRKREREGKGERGRKEEREGGRKEGERVEKQKENDKRRGVGGNGCGRGESVEKRGQYIVLAVH